MIVIDAACDQEVMPQLDNASKTHASLLLQLRCARWSIFIFNSLASVTDESLHKREV